MCAKANISVEQLAIATQQAQLRGYCGPQGQLKRTGDRISFNADRRWFSRPGSYCFDEFLIDHLKYTFGKQWGRSQAKQPRHEQHVVMQWMFDMVEDQRQILGLDHDPRIVVAARPSGSAMAIISLADDLYRLRLVDCLPETILTRLRKRDPFQGARYEVALAASFVRSGFTIDWIEGETDPHGEFIATLPSTNESFVVEAKSRRRSGVLHESGTQLDFEQTRVGIRKLYERALKKDTKGLPLMISVDVNLPLAIDDLDSRERWFSQIQQTFKSLRSPSESQPSKEFCLAFTNSGWHFSGSAIAPAHQLLYTFPNCVEAAPSNVETFAAIIQALNSYGQRHEVMQGL